jgi:hypothetical protein
MLLGAHWEPGEETPSQAGENSLCLKSRTSLAWLWDLLRTPFQYIIQVMSKDGEIGRLTPYHKMFIKNKIKANNGKLRTMNGDPVWLQLKSHS